MTTPSVRVSFIIPVRNDAVRLKRCLESIRRNREAGIDLEIIVADNGSTDDSPDVAAAEGARVLRLPGLRVSELRNRAALAATGSVLAFVDADHELIPTWTAGAIDALQDANIGAAGALYSAPRHGTWVQRMYGALRGRSTGRREVGWLGSGNLVVRRRAFAAIGGFDASLEACEDVDFCQRLRDAGWRLLSDDRLESVHWGDPPTLSALFRAERWRGRDNIRVSLRGRLAMRDIPSLLIPIVDLGAAAAIVGGAVTIPAFGLASLAVAIGGLATIAGLALLRTIRIALNVPSRGLQHVPPAFLVALTYDVARALALTTRAPHHRRPPSAAMPAAR